MAATTAGTRPSKTTRRGWVLAVTVIAQLLVVLDASVVNVALPQVQADLGLNDADRAGVVTLYSLAFGGLLLIGGRLGDVMGMKRVFIVGVLVFTCASAAGGLALNGPMLLGARFGQGVGAALLAPAGLALLTAAFPDGPARARAFAVFGAAVGSGGIVGMLLGGLLTSAASWRWCLLVNVPLGVMVVVIAAGTLREGERSRRGFDLVGAVTSTLGTACLLYGISTIAESGRATTVTFLTLSGGVLLLSGFVAWEARIEAPLLPLSVLTHRVRGAAFGVIFLANGAAYGFYLLLTYYLQTGLGYSPLQTGASFVPVGVGIFVGASLAGRRIGRFPDRAPSTITRGLLVAVVGMGGLGLLMTDVSPWWVLLPGQLLVGVGLGGALTAVVSRALEGLPANNVGTASALTHSFREIGGAIGISLLNVVAVTVGAAHRSPGGAGAARDGLVVAFVCAALLLVAAAALSAFAAKAHRAPWAGD